ncbi:MAG: DUF4185 domain-containing protein [Deltaproteobacteria bacterium]|nr:DUF4185 domain-containing protein [Deltaproteobacteria bacterium]
MARVLFILVFSLISKVYAFNADVEYVKPLIPQVNNDGKVIGQDGAYSIGLNGESLWLFGDTFFGNKNSDNTFSYVGAVHNTASISLGTKGLGEIENITYKKDSKGYATYLLQNIDNEDPKKLKLWPGHGVQIEDKIYIYYSLVEIFGTGSFDFRHAGQGIAVGKNPLGPYNRLTYEGSTALWKKDQPRFGVAVLKGKNRWIYIYGRNEKSPYEFKLVRVKEENISDINSYFYLSKNEKWSPIIDEAITLFIQGPAEGSISFNEYLGKYVLLYSRVLEKDVVIRTANVPWGKWSTPKTIYKCQQKKPDGFCYAAKEHPQYSSNKGKITYFTQVDSSCFFCSLPDLYKIEFKK